MIKRGILLLLLMPFCYSFDYVIDDTTFCPVPNIAKPAKGVKFVDPCFHMNVTRISNGEIEAESSYKHTSAGYPKHNIENIDNSLILAYGGCSSGFGMYNANPPYDKVHCLPVSKYGFSMNARSPGDPRWDDDDPNKWYCARRMQFWYYNVTDDNMYMLHNFSDNFQGTEHFKITMREEGDGSFDKNFWAYGVYIGNWERYDVVSYDVEHRRVVGALYRDSFGDWVSMTPYGKPALGRSPILVYDREFRNPPKEVHANGGTHVDFGIDDQGREVVLHGYGYNWRMEDVETGESIDLVQRDHRSGMSYHVDASAFDRPGWGLISTYPTRDLPASAWADYSIYLVELTRRTDPQPRIWRIAHTHTDGVGYGLGDPFAKFNRKGTRIYWTSNWGDRDGVRDIYMVELPPNWYDDLKDDLLPPVIMHPKPDGIIYPATSAEISVRTDETSTCRYSLSSGVDYDSMTNAFTAEDENWHTAQIAGLSEGQTYKYYVKCKNEKGVESSEDRVIEFYSPNNCGSVLHGDCSAERMLCFDGTFAENCRICGCEEGDICQNDFTCFTPADCGDLTHGECSDQLPKYCNNGVLEDNCQECGCGTGDCQSDGRCQCHEADDNPMNNEVSSEELLQYIHKWRIGEQVISLPNLLGAIDKWKNGC